MELEIKSEPIDPEPEPMDTLDTNSETILSSEHNEQIEIETEHADVPHLSQTELRVPSDVRSSPNETERHNQDAGSSSFTTSASTVSSTSTNYSEDMDLKPPIGVRSASTVVVTPISADTGSGSSSSPSNTSNTNGASINGAASGAVNVGDGYTSDGSISPESASSSESGDYGEFESVGFGLINLLEQIEGYQPSIPEPVSDYFLHMSGFKSSDPRVSKLISICAQKFISDILNDALTHCKLRTAAPIGGKTKSKDKKYVLTLEDLVPVLSDYGITVKKPPYFV